MKLTALLTLLLLSVSCMTEHGPKTESNTGEIVRYEPLTPAPEELTRIKSICKALDKKGQLLHVLENSKYIFSYAQKSCKDNDIQAASNVEVFLKKSGDHYIFSKANGDAFAFRDVETTKMGAMSEICNNLMDLKSPMQTSRSGAIWFTTFTSSKDCESDYNHVCIHIQRGSHSAGYDYKIHTNEWIKFKIRDQREGFFVEKKQVSSADCEAGRTLVKRATLK
jgi:hypothetical protein